MKLETVPHAGPRPVLNGYQQGRIVWPTETQDLAHAQRNLMLGYNEVLFTSDFPNSGFKNYAERNPAGIVRDIDYGICASPAGDGEIVAWCDNRRGLTNGNVYQRSQVQTGAFVKPIAHDNTQDIYAVYFRVWIDDQYPFSSASHWINFLEYHGGPYVTSSGLGLMMVWDATTGHHLRMGNDASVLGKAAKMKLGQWVQIALICKYAYQDQGGWGDLFINLSADVNEGWERIPMRGGFRQPYDVVRVGEGDGWITSPREQGGQWAPSHAKWGPYGNVRGVFYCAEHNVARTMRAAMPATWSGTFNGFNPDIIE